MTIPPKTRPAPPPMPCSAETSPSAPGTRLIGNSSRTIEKASGKIPPPAPWITRPAIISQNDEAMAEMNVPNASMSRTIRSRRSFPYMSPSLPRIGVATEALSR